MEYYIRTEPDVNIFVHDINPNGRKTILFIHGWPLNHRAYEYQFNKLPALGFRCIGMDTRGFGKSSKPYTGYSYNRIADDIRGVVNALNLKNFILGGHSMGGAAAIRYMARYKGYGVAKLALFGAAAPSLTMRPGFPYGQSKEAITQIIDESLRDRASMLRDTAKLFFYKPVTGPQSDWFFSLSIEASGTATAQCAITFRDEALFEDLPKIRVPTLIMHGIHDQVCYYPLAEFMHQSIANSILIPFEKSGHGLFFEEQQKFNQELVRFIG